MASYAVVRRAPKGWEIVRTGIAPQPASAQTAELTASRTHRPVPLRRKGFVTSNGSPVKHLQPLLDLYHALKEPKQVAVMKCKGHQTYASEIVKGNNAANQAAVLAAWFAALFPDDAG